MRRHHRFAIAIALLLPTSAARGQESSTDAEPPASHDAQPEGTEAEEDEGEDTPARQATETPNRTKAASTASPNAARTEAAPSPSPLSPGFRDRLHLAFGPLTLAPLALLQTQVSPYVGERSLSQAGDIAERPGFRLRRARLGLRGDAAGQVRFAFAADLSGSDDGAVSIHDAWAGYTGVPAAQIFAGARDVPFSRSAMTGAGDGALIERPLAVRAIAPFTQVGLQAEGHFGDGAFSYYAGVYNGLQRSEQFYAGHAESFAPRGNRFEGVALAGRLATEPLGPLGRTIQDLAHSPVRIGAGADYFFSNGGARTLHGASADVLLHASGLHLLAELLWTRANPKSVPTQPITQVTAISSLALVFEAGYMIIPRALGASTRVEWIDPNPEIDDEGDNVVITGGISYHAFDDLLKAQLDFTHREELGGLSISNDALTLSLQLSL